MDGDRQAAVEALLVGETLPPKRLGELLRATRKRRGWKRRQVAAMVRIDAPSLRAYERGEEPVPADVYARLADCYGEDLTTHVPLRVAPHLDANALRIRDEEHRLHDASLDDVVATYVELVRRLRGAKPGATLPLRTADVTALAAALETSPDAMEAHIMDALGCSRDEARALHRELLRRKVVLPVAGLAVSVVAMAGVHAAHAAAHGNDAPPLVPAASRLPAPVVAPPKVVVTRQPPAAPHTPSNVPVTIAYHAPASHPPASPAAVASHPTAPASAPAADPPASVSDAASAPVIPYDPTPEGVLPGEHPLPPPH